MNYPIELYEMPDVHNIKKIKYPIYEGYAAVSEEALFKKDFITDLVKYTINNFRTRNFFVKKVYCKYLVQPQGLTILAFELVRLREPIIEKLWNEK